MKIRTLGEADASAVNAVLNPIIAQGGLTVMTAPISEADQIAYMQTLAARGVYLGAFEESAGKLLGVQSVEPAAAEEPAFAHVGDISTFVALDARRGGVGRRLFDATLEAAGACGYAKLIAVIRRDNPAALRYYAGIGFRTVGVLERHARVGDALIDEVLAERFIG